MMQSMWFKAVRQTLATREVRWLLGLTFVQICGATVFYHWAEKWSWIDSLYFSVITVATVGYGDFAPKTDYGKLFTVGYILFGIGIFVTATATLAGRFLAIAKDEIVQQHYYESDHKNKR